MTKTFTEPVAVVFVTGSVAVTAIDVVPAATPCSAPVDAPTVATDAALDAYVDRAVRSAVLPSLNVPITDNCPALPTINGALAAVTLMELNVGATVTVMVPDLPDSVAVIVDVPEATPVTTPAADTVATDVFELAYEAVLVTFWVEPFE